MFNLFNSIKGTLSSTLNQLKPACMSSSCSNQNSVLIFLHGLGDQGSSWHMQLAPMVPSHVKCICPTAQMNKQLTTTLTNHSPTMPVTLNMGMRMPSWFDLRSLNPNDPEDEEGIISASKKIHELIEEQVKQGVPNERILLGGFSQGGALALYAAFTYPKKLAGVVALSCWLPLHQKAGSILNEANKHIAVLQCHGSADFVVPLQWGIASERVMSSFLDTSKYTFKVYDGLSHSSSATELDDVLNFVKQQLPTQE